MCYFVCVFVCVCVCVYVTKYRGKIKLEELFFSETRSCALFYGYWGAPRKSLTNIIGAPKAHLTASCISSMWFLCIFFFNFNLLCAVYRKLCVCLFLFVCLFVCMSQSTEEKSNSRNYFFVKLEAVLILSALRRP